MEGIHVCRKHVKYSLRDVGVVDSVAHLNLHTNVCHCLMKRNEKLMGGSIVVKHIMSVEKTGSLY